jgi:flagellar biosynthesis/type III secretory pathway M-ring protein FliF/YscJ
MKDVLDALLSLVPPLLVGCIFWIIMRSIVRIDSKERDTYAKIEAEERAKLEAAKKP